MGLGGVRVSVRVSARVRVRGSARVRDRVRGSVRVRDRAIRSKTVEVLGAKTPATKKQKNKITKWAKRTKRKGKKKHNQQSRRQKICILNSHQPENNQR